MINKKFIIYVDILGFWDLPIIISPSDPDVWRQNNLTDPLGRTIEEIERNGIQIRKEYSAITGSDDYLIFVDDLCSLWKYLHKLTNIPIPCKEYPRIPLEIAVGTIDLDSRVKDPINSHQVIKFKKDDIVTPYKREIEAQIGKKLTRTFLLFIESAYEELENWMKEKGTSHAYIRKSGKTTIDARYYELPLEVVEGEEKISDFFRHLNVSRSNYTGALIPSTYIKPAEWDQIINQLESSRFIILTGTPGYGKTYTAIRILWEWFLKNYTPVWFIGAQRDQRTEVKEKLASIDAHLKSGNILYFEDPFGRNEYEPRDDLGEKSLSIISNIKNIPNVYVIITSRKDVFDAFLKTCHEPNLSKYIIELNIVKPSYDIEDRKRILKEWAKNFQCKWLRKPFLKESILKSLNERRILPTPLSIYHFAEGTIQAESLKELQAKLHFFSAESERVFAEEIIGLYKSGRTDRVYLLIIMLILQEAEFVCVKKVYETLTGYGADDFNCIIKEETKLIENKYYNTIRFSHPSFLSTLPYLFDDFGLKKIIHTVLFALAEKDSAVEDVAKVVAENFDRLPKDTRNLLFILAEKDSAALAVTGVVMENFDRLPNDVRNRLLIMLAEKDSAALAVTGFVAENFDRLPEDVRNLLFMLAKKDSEALSVAWVVAENFNRLPKDVRNRLLIMLAEKDSAAWGVVRAVAENFDRLPEDVRNRLLIMLAEKDSGASEVAWIVAHNIDRLPNDVRNRLLIMLAEKDSEDLNVTWVVAHNIDRLPDDVRNQLINRLSK